ncbi:MULTISPECIES: FHA domain-containing protein FhaB/FipA [Actinomyces]|uniref:FHA domain-containing protein FhaB/FipA n=1 Tax=Actinomyces TaxID=1654 RepID=UPI00109DED98|nr:MULTISPECIES: FHA domain-containing protein [Actinomyces]
MSQLAFTIARLGFLVLLWVFVFFVVRALRRDVAEVSAPPARRRSTRDAAPVGRNRGPTRLVITEGPLAGSMVPLTPTSITIGRDQNCTLVLNDSYASSRHARVFPKDGAWWLEDLSSTNGTTLAGRPVHGAVELPVGVPVRIGQTTLELRP